MKRRSKKVTGKELVRITGSKYLLCKECKEEESLVSKDTKSVICAYCVQKMLAPPHNYKPEASGDTRPKGWNLKKFIELDGKVYVKGVEITDAEEIKKLRKAAKPTKKVKSNDRIAE